MRNWIIGAAALLAVAAPGVASAATGYAGVVYSNTDTDGLDNVDAYGVQGSVAFEGSSSISFEVDGVIADCDHCDTAESLTGHAFTRNDDYLFGGFVGIANSDSDTAWQVGLEANKYIGNWTLAGAVAYEDDNDADVSAWGVNAQARYFVTDNFRVQAEAGWAKIDFGGGGGNTDATSLGVGGEYQFDAAPVSIALNYDHVSVDDGGADSNVWSVALRYNWGGTLRDRDRHGASQADIAGVGAGFGLNFGL